MGSLRGTGRTTRMLEEARRLEAQGRAVYVIAANRRQMGEFRRALGWPDTSIAVETPGSLGNFSWESMQLQGAHPNCVVLVDHCAIESRFGRILEMLHRWDAPQKERDDG